MELSTLPIVPLSAVLLPGSTMSMRMFEDRYLRLLADRATDQPAFAVALIISGNEVNDEPVFHQVATTARVQKINDLSNRAVDLVIVGEERVSLTEVSWERGYAVAAATDLPDVEFDVQSGSEQAIGLFRSYARLLRIAEPLFGGKLNIPILPINPVQNSYELARWLPLTSAEHQQLLETSDPLARMDTIAWFINRERRLLTRGGVAAFPLPNPGARFGLN